MVDGGGRLPEDGLPRRIGPTSGMGAGNTSERIPDGLCHPFL
jgi:hypothetical protein